MPFPFVSCVSSMPPKKVKRTKATVVVLDVGKGMDGRQEEQTYLEQALDGVGNLIQQRVKRKEKFFFFG